MNLSDWHISHCMSLEMTLVLPSGGSISMEWAKSHNSPHTTFSILSNFTDATEIFCFYLIIIFYLKKNQNKKRKNQQVEAEINDGLISANNTVRQLQTAWFSTKQLFKNKHF